MGGRGIRSQDSSCVLEVMMMIVMNIYAVSYKGSTIAKIHVHLIHFSKYIYLQ